MEADRIFQGSIPALYDRHLGPLIFAPYAEDLASRLADVRYGRILETAAGTGVVTRAQNVDFTKVDLTSRLESSSTLSGIKKGDGMS